MPLPLRLVLRENYLKRADEVLVVTQCACRTFVPTVRDQDDVCDFGANDRDDFEPPILIEVKDRDVRHFVRPQRFLVIGPGRQC